MVGLGKLNIFRKKKYLALIILAIGAVILFIMRERPIIKEVYFESTVPPEWFEDYSEIRVEHLLKEFQESGAITKWLESQSNIGKVDSNLLSITMYKDFEDGYDKPIWIIRLSLPNNWGFSETNEMLKPLGESLGQIIKKYKHEPTVK